MMACFGGNGTLYMGLRWFVHSPALPDTVHQAAVCLFILYTYRHK